MPRQRSRKTQSCQTDYDNWIEHQINEGVEKIAVKIKSQFEDQVTKLKSDIEAKLKSEIEAKLKSDIEAKLKSDIEAKLKSDIEAKLKPDIEAKLKPDIEAKLKADLEAKLKSDIEAKVKRDIQTKMKSDIESKLKADIEAKLKSDIEAKLKPNLESKMKQDIASTTKELQGKMDEIENDNYFELRKVQNQLDEKETHIKLMMKSIDQLEQWTKANNIRIAGMKEEEGEDIIAKVIDLARGRMNIQHIEAADIKEVGRMGKPNQMKTRDILVKFNNNNMREQMYSKRKLLISKDYPIYVNEDLTLYRSQLFFEARKIRKKGHLFGAWTQSGNVMIKVNQNDIPRAVSSNNDLKTLVQNYSDSEEDIDLYD